MSIGSFFKTKINFHILGDIDLKIHFWYHLIMRIIKKETDYAIRALYFINSKGGMASSSDIYNEIDLPRPFIRKILQMLTKSGILKSYKGKGGGFELKIPFKDITLYMIEEIFAPKMRRGECPFKSRICSNFSRCYLKLKIYEIEKRFIEDLSKIKLIDLWR